MGNSLNKTAVLDRIKRRYSLKGNTDLARFLGVAPNTITNWYNRGTFDIDAIFTKCENVNFDWLLTGNGNMVKTKCDRKTSPCGNSPVFSDKDKEETSPNQTFSAEDAGSGERPVASHATQPGEGIPLIPVDAMAGALAGEQTVLEYECERYVVPVFKGADFLIPVKGSSMYPKYSSGDIVACQRVPMDGLFFQWNKVYVIDTNQGALIKRIKPGSDSEHVLIVSDNEKYDPFELHLSSIYAVALVIGVIRLE